MYIFIVTQHMHNDNHKVNKQNCISLYINPPKTSDRLCMCRRFKRTAYIDWLLAILLLGCTKIM